jgi:hypothetical protein
MKNFFKLLSSGMIGAAIILTSLSSTVNAQTTNATATKAKSQSTNKGQNSKVNIEGWPDTAKKAAKAMMEKYGEPAESTPNMLVWHNTGPFKRTIVYKEEIDHDFPMPHKDVLEQFVNYEVPADKFDELANFDGSVIAERTKGEISARCDKEAANILALNLADDIIKDKRNVEEAREFYGSTMMEMLQGNKPQYLQKLQFNAAKGNVGDSDKVTMDMSKVKQLKGKNNKNQAQKQK